MSRAFSKTLLVLLILTGIGRGTPALAERDWVRVGSYLDWPESLTQATEEQVEPDSAVRVQYLQPAPFLDPAALAESSEPAVLPGVVTSVPLSTYGWQLLPQGLLYHSYLAGEKEPRFAAQWLWDRERGLVFESALGGRWGVVRKGTFGPNGEGFQFDVEGAALARVDPTLVSDPLEAVDFRAGLLGTWRRGRWRWKFGYYHLSSHIGDEYLLNNPGFPRLNYVRDSILFGIMYDITPDLQIYGEIADALNHNGGAKPLELQFGAQYSPAMATGPKGAPFAAINGHLRQEFNMGGSVNIEAGWAWRGPVSGHLLRAGFQHYNGPSMQWSFLDRYESMTGMGIWFDF